MKSKWENFWYYHKWKVIVIAFFATVGVIGIVQILTRSDYDAQVLYAGPWVSVADSESGDRASAAFSRLISKLEGQKDSEVLFRSVTVLSEEQFAQKEEEAKKEGDHVSYSDSMRQESLSEIRTLLLTGQVSICLLDPYVYETLNPEESFVPLTDLLDEVPDCARDERSVYLKDTEFGQKIDFSFLPEDTVLCLYRQVNSTKSASKESYDRSCALFRAIFEN